MNPPGNEAPLARFLADWALAQGLEAEVVELPDPRAPRGRAALVVRVRGRGTPGAVILLSHLDVVPAGDEGWEAPPFAGTRVGEAVVGRGALDAKGVTVTHLIAALRLAVRERPLARDLLVIAVPDEEKGGLGGAAALIEKRPDLVDGARYLLGEGGSISPGITGRRSLWAVGFTEKSPCWLDVRAKGLSGHGASGQRGTAVQRLLRALGRIQDLPFPVRVVPEVARTFRSLAPLAPEGDEGHWIDLRRSLSEDPDFRERFLAEPGQAARVRDTLAITRLRSGDGYNRLTDEAVAGLDLRLLPGGDCAATAARLREAIDDPAVTVEVHLAFESRSSPVETALMAAIEGAARKLDPGALVAPSLQLGWSDAHWFRARGVVAYGFVPRRLRPIDLRSIHGPGERLTIDNLVLGIEGTVSILEELDRDR